MKKTLLFLFLSGSLHLLSQPVITNGNNIPGPGLSVSLTYTPLATYPSGSPGANQTWNYGSLTTTYMGNLTTINPATSSFSTAFSTATHGNNTGNNYTFYKTSSTKMEVMAYSITSPSVGNDYSPNPLTALKFPFNFGDMEVDTWQKVGGPVNTTSVSYDGYGTLITPLATYTNVVRIKDNHGNGNIDFHWYILNPLMPVASYYYFIGGIYFMNATQLSTGIEAQGSQELAVSLYPNPASGQFSIEFSGIPVQSDLNLQILNVSGQLVKSVPIRQQQTSIRIDEFPAGMYIYQLKSGNANLKTGKVVVE